MDANDIHIYEAFKQQQADELRQQESNREYLERQNGYQMVRETIEESFSYNSSLNLEKLITDTFENLRSDELNDPDIIVSVAESLLDEAEIGEYDAVGEELD